MGKTIRLPPLPRRVEPVVDWQSGSEGSDVMVRATGLSALEENLRRLPGIAKDAAGTEMAQIMSEVIDDAKELYVPFRSGRLHDSGDSDDYEPSRTGQLPELTQIAGWFGAPGAMGLMAEPTVRISSRHAREAGVSEIVDPHVYAEIQHEDPTFQHHPPPEMSGYKYLERPWSAKEPTMMARIATRISKVLIEGGYITDLAPIEADLRAAPAYPGYGAGRRK